MSFEELCEVLAEATTGKDVPPEDARISKREKILIRVSKILGIVNLLVSVGFIIFYFVSLKTEHRFLNFEEQWCFVLLMSYGGFVLATVLSIVLVHLCSEKRIIRYPFRKICALCVASILILTFSIPWSFISTVTIVAAVTTSETEKIENYLQLDKFVEKQKNEVFPEAIPVEAEQVKYHYRYCSELFEYNFDIFAEWKLPNDMFEDIVGSKLYYFVEAPVSVDKYNEVTYELQLKKREVIQKGNWKLIYYEDSDVDRKWTNDENSYYISVFAYNEKTNTVRYILSASDYGGHEPYYVSLEW